MPADPLFLARLVRSRLFPASLSPVPPSQPRRLAGLSGWIAVLLVAGGGSAVAQVDPEDGPLADSPLFEKENALGNVVLLHTVTDGPTGSDVLLQTSFDYVPPDESGLNAGLLPQDGAELEPDAVGPLLGLEDELDIVSVDLDQDGFAEWVAAWTRRTGEIRVAVPQDLSRQGPDDPGTGLPTLGWSDAELLDLQDLGLPSQQSPTDFERPHRLRLAVGELDGDAGEEVLLGYWDENGQVQLVVIDGDGTRVPRVAAAQAVHTLPPFVARPPGSSLPADETATRSTVFDLGAFDSDGDGIDEILLVAGELTGADDWLLRARALLYQPLVPGFGEVTSVVLETQASAGEHVEYVEVVGGNPVLDDPSDPVVEEAVVAFQVDRSTVLADLRAEHRMGVLSLDLDNEILVSQVRIQQVHPDPADGGDLPESELSHLSLGLGDFDADGVDEIVLPTGPGMDCQVVDTFLQCSAQGSGRIDLFRATPGFPGSFALVGSEPRRLDRGSSGSLHGLLAVLDLDPDPADPFPVPEIVSATLFTDDFPDRILLQAFTVESAGPGPLDFDLDLVAENGDIQLGNASNLLAIDAGLFNGPDLRLGTPKRFSETRIAQPLVILSAPPIHFDVLGGQSFDVNDCFPVGVASCDFESSYEQVIQSSTTVSTEFHSDWTLSTELSADASGLGAAVEGSLRASVGEGFSRVESEQRTETVTLGQTADLDDFLFAATITYDVWEYPVFEGASTTPSGHVAVVRPRFEDPQGITLAWFNSKSFLAQSFQPSHEVGNILSYREIAAPDEASGFVEEVRFSTSDLRTLTDQGGGGFWSLAQNEVTEVSTSFEARLGLEASVATEAGFEFDLGGFSPGSATIRTQVDGDYSSSELSTTEVFFEQSVGINFEFGTLDPSVGQTNYGVIPYVYWTTTGALVLDYAVRPELAPPGFPDTFWQERYGAAPDPAFILPFRLDTEKGFELGSEPEVRRQQTREIRVAPEDAAPGDTVTVSARVHNYSLLPSPAVELHFYLGDPDDGGERIFPDAAGPIVSDVLPPRQSDVVSFEWTIPLDVEVGSARIYAVLDPDDVIAGEIHEDNNQGWNALVIPAPEPRAILLQVALLAALSRLSRRRTAGA